MSPLDVLAEELGAVAGRIERESGLRIAAAIADLQRHDAEREARLTQIELMVRERLSSLKDGERGLPGERGERGLPGDPGRDGLAGERGEQGLPGEAGRDGLNGDRGEPGERGERGFQGERGEPGERGADGQTGERGAPGDRGEAGPPGNLPLVREWAEGVHYEGDVVTLAGETYQAQRDTGHSPPHADWIKLAARGGDGRTPAIRGTYTEGGDYRELDVVALNGGSFVARRDNPGACPGEGWQLMASPGKRGDKGLPGDRGERGEKGERGSDGISVVGLHVDDEGVLTLSLSDRTTLTADFYPVLERIRG